MSKRNLAEALAYNAKPLQIDSLVPNANHARKHDAEGIKKAARQIGEFGFTMPILVKPDGKTIIAGHRRWEAAKLLELPEVPVIVADGWSEAQCRAYALADNRLAQDGEWDDDALARELQFLIDAEYDAALTGFDEEEIAALLAGQVEGLTDEDDTPEVPIKGVTEPGDVWICGKHRVRCGDSTKAEDVEALLAGIKPHLMVTDPPYGVEYDANWRNEVDRANGKPYGDRAVGKVANDDKADWTEVWALFPGDVAYIWHAGNMANVVADSLIKTGFGIRAQIIWAKSQLVISRGDYHPQHEPCWYAVRKSKTGHWQGDRKQTTVWHIDKPQKSETGHSTQKPVECMRRPIVNNSSPGQAVYDPFLGSGTTLIAAETEGRICYGMELNPLYVDVIVQRWQEFTGDEARLEGAGDTYAEVKNHRHGGVTTGKGKVRAKSGGA